MSLKFDFDLNEALDRENVTKKTLCDIRESQPNGMPQSITDHQLLLFYVACEKNFEQTRDAIESYYHYKHSNPSLFSDCDPTSEKVQQCLKNQFFFFLPVTPNNCSVIYARLQNSDPNNYFLNRAIKTYLMTVDSCLSQQGPRSGIIFLFDAKNAHLGHLKRCTLSTVATFCTYVNKSLPARLDGIYVINAPWYFESILSIVRPFLRKDRVVNVFGHTTDCTQILKNVVPKECLPSDLGGDLDTVEELHRQHSERLMKMKNFFTEEENQWKI